MNLKASVTISEIEDWGKRHLLSLFSFSCYSFYFCPFRFWFFSSFRVLFSFRVLSILYHCLISSPSLFLPLSPSRLSLFCLSLSLSLCFSTLVLFLFLRQALIVVSDNLRFLPFSSNTHHLPLFTPSPSLSLFILSSISLSLSLLHSLLSSLTIFRSSSTLFFSLMSQFSSLSSFSLLARFLQHHLCCLKKQQSQS